MKFILPCPQPFHDGGCYHIETSLLICGCPGFYMITAFVMKGLNKAA